MDRQQLFEAAKLRIRKMQSDALDEDVRQYVSFALADLERIGVPSADLQKPDALLSEAVLVYVQANFVLTKIKGSKHCIKGVTA